MTEAVVRYLQQHRPTILARLEELLRIPSISTDAAYDDDMRRACDLWQRRLRAGGLEQVTTLRAGGHAAVFGQWCHAVGRPTIMIYGHYDVQPPDPLSAWVSPPFEPTWRNGRLYARGVSDDKAPASIAIETVMAYLSVEGRLPVNIKILLEGEEEIGSASLAAIFDRHRNMLAADAVLSADGARWQADLPTVNIGARGVATLNLALTAGEKDLHSGRYGGVAANAIHIMATLLASLHSDDGAIAVAGIEDGVVRSGEHRMPLEELPFDEAAFMAGAGAQAAGDTDLPLLERLWHRPSLDINGFWGGYTGPGSKTVIPHQTSAKLSLRLAPGQQPKHIVQSVKTHLQQRLPIGIRLDIEEGAAVPAYTVPSRHPLLAAVETAIAETAGRPPYRIRIGATLPLCHIVSESLGIDTVMFSYSVADEDFHAPNEFFRKSSFDEGFAGWARVLDELGRQSAEDYAAFRAAGN